MISWLYYSPHQQINCSPKKENLMCFCINRLASEIIYRKSCSPPSLPFHNIDANRPMVTANSVSVSVDKSSSNTCFTGLPISKQEQSHIFRRSSLSFAVIQKLHRSPSALIANFFGRGPQFFAPFQIQMC